MDLCEQVFQADSELVAQLLADLRQEGTLERRWGFCIAGWMSLLTQSDLGLTEQLILVEAARDQYSASLRPSSAAWRLIGHRYRQESAVVRRLMESVVAGYRDVEARPFRSDEGLIHTVLMTLRAMDAEQRLRAPFSSVLRSLMHMRANRMLVGAHREQEFVCHEFLCRALRRTIATLERTSVAS